MLVRKALPKTLSDSGGALFVDLRAESNRLYSSYLQEAILLSLAGLTAIIGLLFVVLCSPRRVAAQDLLRQVDRKP